jgi:hypothetical protein
MYPFRQPAVSYESVMPRLLPLLLLAGLGLSAAEGAWARQGPRRPMMQVPQMQPRMDRADPRFEQPRPQNDASRNGDFPRFPRRQRDDDGSLSDDVRRAQRESGGRVLGAERVQSDGRDITRIKVMDGDGRVRFIDSDRQSRRGSGQRPPDATDGDPPITP